MRRLAVVTAGIILLLAIFAGLYLILSADRAEQPIAAVIPRAPSLLEYDGLSSSELVRNGDTLEVVERESAVLPASPEAPDGGSSHGEVARALPPGDAPTKAGFSVEVKKIVSPYRVMGLFVMPKETIEIETTFTRPGDVYTLAVEHGQAMTLEPGKWRWTAPGQPGSYPLLVEGPTRTMTFNVFVKTPFDNERPILEGYTIGRYQTRPLRGDPRFKPPPGLIRVDEDTEEILVSPHFTLGAFTCHQPGDPKFIALDEQLLLKLEMLLEQVKLNGIDASTFVVMSGYRTPHYNRSIGNTTVYSQHLFGLAADIFIDEDRDGRMDDLNRDGRIDKKDARVLYRLVDEMRSQTWYQPFLGGLGLYGSNARRGPFIHVDSRGYAARW